jgi:transcriptional regulator GlxA family with amidase domain
MLELTGRTIDQVAWDVGYEDAGSFRKVFQKVVGLKPGDYRKRFGATSSTQSSTSSNAANKNRRKGLTE